MMYWINQVPSTVPTVALIGEDRLLASDIEKMELLRARGALALLKTKLGNERMHELLAEELAVTTKRTTDWAAASDRAWQTGSMVLIAPGLKAAHFHEFFLTMVKENRQSDLRGAHPDHFQNLIVSQGAEVIENVGQDDLPWFIRLSFTNDLSAFPGDWNPEYPERLGAVIRNIEGVLIGSARHEMKDDVDGMHLLLTICLPAAAPHALIRGHLEHFAIEWTNWTEQARTQT